MFGIRLLNRSTIASTSTSLSRSSNLARWTSQRQFSISRIVNEENSNGFSSFTQQSSDSSKDKQDPSLKWQKVADLAQNTSAEGFSTSKLNNKRQTLNRNIDGSMQAWNAALRSVVPLPASSRPQTSLDLQRAGKKRSELEEMEYLWQNREKNGADRPVIPSDGRSVPVSNGDIGRAMNNLNAIFRANNVRTELRLGERYEKPNQKRRRLASERHRRRFAHMVREKVQLVSITMIDLQKSRS